MTPEERTAWQATQEAQWSEQWRENERATEMRGNLNYRLSSLERRVIFLASSAAALGALVGSKLPSLF